MKNQPVEIVKIFAISVLLNCGIVSWGTTTARHAGRIIFSVSFLVVGYFPIFSRKLYLFWALGCLYGWTFSEHLVWIFEKKKDVLHKFSVKVTGMCGMVWECTRMTTALPVNWRFGGGAPKVELEHNANSFLLLRFLKNLSHLVILYFSLKV